MGKKKASKNKKAKSTHEGNAQGDGDDYEKPLTKPAPQPIESSMVYGLAQFIESLSISLPTFQKYVAAGLPVRGVPGTRQQYVLGQEWFKFIAGQAKVKAKDIKLEIQDFDIEELDLVLADSKIIDEMYRNIAVLLDHAGIDDGYDRCD